MIYLVWVLLMRRHIINRLKHEIAIAPEPSLWYTNMTFGDVSEFGDMMANLEIIMGVDTNKVLDWNAIIRDIEKKNE